MHFKPDPDEAAFRAKIRAFLETHLPPELARRGKRGYTPRREDMLRWQSILFEHGLAAPHWAVENGGAGWGGGQRMIFEQELGRANAPPVNVQGLALFGPVLNAFGTDEQKARFREPLLSGKMIWCQGFSEPGSGSDLASLQTRADRRGDGWVINGQKIWTSQANLADWAFLLARTRAEGKKQEGISFFLIDMKSPGVSVQPIISIDGQHHLNQTFYDNVILPGENLIGREGQGWEIAKFLLNNERLFGSAEMPKLYQALARVEAIARAEHRCGRPLIDDANFAARLARLEIEVMGIEMKLMETSARATISERDLAIVGSVVKVRASETYMALEQLALEAIGDYGALSLPDPEGSHSASPDAAPDYAQGCAAGYFYSRAASIYGGANEIQRNIIAKASFGL